jgi:hypothetical protein
VNKQQLLSWLPLIGSKPSHEQNRTGWVIASCPMKWRHGGQDKHPSFAARIEAGDSFTNCFSCGYHGSQSDLVIEIGHLNKANPFGPLQLGEALQLIALAEDADLDLDLSAPDIEQMLFGEKPKPTAFPEAWLQSFPEAWESKAAREYLLSRAIPEEISNALDLRYDPKQERVCFPVRDFNGVLRGLHGRALQAEHPMRYRMYTHKGANNPLIWLGEHWVDLDLPIVVVEGPFDLVSVMRVYRNVVTPLFASPSLEKLTRMQDALEWVTLLDNGTGGNIGRSRITKALAKHLVTHLLPPAGKDPGSMLVGELVQLLEPHLPLDNILLA